VGIRLSKAESTVIQSGREHLAGDERTSMPRTPLLRSLHRTATRAAHRESRDEPAGLSRRRLLTTSAASAAGVGLAATGLYAAVPAGAATSGTAVAKAGTGEIVVIGAGLAGLTAAYQLQKAGYRATVIEAADRVGGRCHTDRTTFAGQIAEHGGELIDTGHKAILGLIAEFGLSTTNLVAAEPAGSTPLYHFDGSPYAQAVAQQELAAVADRAAADAKAAKFPTTYASSTARGRELDAMSIDDWIRANVSGGTASKVGQLLSTAYTIEYGAESSAQSALNLIYLFGYQKNKAISLFGPSDEVYHVTGGNDLIVSKLAAKLAGQITTGTALKALARTSTGQWAVTVGPSTGPGSSRTLTADRVLLALPFSLLRAVDLTKAGFPARKTAAIQQLKMGTNTKLHLQFTKRIWNQLGGNGEIFSDLGFQNTWDVTRGQSGTAGILVDFTGGNAGADFAGKTAAVYAKRFLGQAEPAVPGLTDAWNGKASLDYWTGYAWTKGSYSYYTPGQYTTVTGVEKEPVDGCHFAGEHTSLDFQGYLNGAVETGQRAAQEIIAALR
jgi:monoamine oxidase